jgi:hypothetical protein
MVVGGKGLLDVELFHDYEGTAIDEGPGFVGSFLAKFPGSLVEVFVDVKDLDVGSGFDVVDNLKNSVSGLAEGAVEEGNEFG